MSKLSARHAVSHFGGFGCAMALIIAVFVFCCGAEAQQTQTVLYSAGAYGATAFVGNVVKLAKVAPVGVGSGCGTAKVPQMDTGTAASVTYLPLVATGAVNTSAASATGRPSSAP